MVREFKIRRTPFKVWLGVTIVILAIILFALKQRTIGICCR